MGSAGGRHAAGIYNGVTMKLASPALQEPDKARAHQQWTVDPCGASTSAQSVGTREFFAEVERYRYQDYAPWMPRVMGFALYPGRRLLEVGCGMGTDLAQFARGGTTVCGTDLTLRSLELARQRFAVEGLAGQFLACDAEALPFPDQSFEVVYSNGVLHHTPDTEKAVREIHRVLKPGGVAIVMLYHRHSLYYWGKLFFALGLLRGKLLQESMADILRQHVEYSTSGARPLVKVYSRGEVQRLFGGFRRCEVGVHQLTLSFLPLPRSLRQPIERLLEPLLGWNVIAKAEK